MKGENVFRDLRKIAERGTVSKNDFVRVLKEYSKLISVYDLANAAAVMRKGMKYVQEEYREPFVKPYLKTFILGLNALSNQKENLTGNVDYDLFTDSLENLEHNFHRDPDLERERCNLPLIMTLSSLYVTFIKEEPLHPVGSLFPGNIRVYEENGIFYCPVKDAQKDNPDALCIFCLAEQTPNVH